MPDYLGAVGLLFFLFFLVAAATEAILETMRGGLGQLGFTLLNSNKSLDDAVRASTEFLPPGSEARGKVAALEEAVKNTRKIAQTKLTEIAAIRKDIDAIVPGASVSDVTTVRLNSLTLYVKDLLDRSERNRVFVLRLLSTVIAVLLCYQADLDAVKAMVQAYPQLFAGIFKFYNVNVVGNESAVTGTSWASDHVGVILTGVAAASGSSYWHDKLDKIRNLKDAQEQFRKLVA